MEPMQMLHEAMLKTTRETLKEADAILALIPATKHGGLFDREFTGQLLQSGSNPRENRL